MTFKRWKDEKPEDRAEGQVYLWKTLHKRLQVRMVFSGPLHRMRNGWDNTYHLLPPMTHWDGYNHIIPTDLEWAPAPSWILERATISTRLTQKPQIIAHLLERLLEVEGVPMRPCPFCGKKPTWESRDGFIGAMPHQHGQFSLGCCMRTLYYQKPADAARLWNTRAADAYFAHASHLITCTIAEGEPCSCGLKSLRRAPEQEYFP